MDKQKILIFTNVFPRDFDRNKGLAVREEVERLRRYFDIKVISAIPQNFLKAKVKSIPQKTWVDDIEIFQPRYYTVPKIGTLFSGYSCFLAINKVVGELKERFGFSLILSYWTYPDGFAASLCAKRLNVPLIIRPRGSDINEFLGYGILRSKIKTAFRRADKILPKSKDMQERIERIGVDKDKIFFIYNGIDLDEFYPQDKKRCRERLGIPMDKKMVLFVGNLLPVKGVNCLTEAIKVLDDRRRSDLVFKIIGSGRQEKMVRGSIKRFKFVSTFLEGEIPHGDLPIWISASDLVCITSLNEGCPNILLESLACGVPVVATNVGGIPEIVDNENLGILVPKKDIYAIADAIEKALERSWEKGLLRDRVGDSSWDRSSERLKDECLALVKGAK